MQTFATRQPAFAADHFQEGNPTGGAGYLSGRYQSGRYLLQLRYLWNGPWQGVGGNLYKHIRIFEALVTQLPDVNIPDKINMLWFIPTHGESR